LDQIGASQKGTRPENDIPHSDVLPLWSLFLARWSKTAVTPFCIRCYVPFCKQTAEGSTNRTEPKYGLTYKPAALMECLPTHFPMTITYLNSKKPAVVLEIHNYFGTSKQNAHFLFPSSSQSGQSLFEKFWEWTIDYNEFQVGLQKISQIIYQQTADEFQIGLKKIFIISTNSRIDLENGFVSQMGYQRWIRNTKIKWTKIIPNDLTTRTIRL